MGVLGAYMLDTNELNKIRLALREAQNILQANLRELEYKLSAENQRFAYNLLEKADKDIEDAIDWL